MDVMPNTASTGKIKAVSDLSEQEWNLAVQRYGIIAPIINNVPNVSAEGIAIQHGINRKTIYRWVKKYQLTQSVSALVNIKKTGGKGLPRIPEDVEAIVKSVIEDRFLNNQKLAVKKISIEIAIQCRAAGLKIPHYNTIRKRISQISAEEKLTRRHHSSFSRDKYKQLDGSFPGADYPLAVVQIDHTPLDIIVVDEVYREPVGKPWITVAIDVYSRMVIGFYISLDPPGALGTGLCLSHAILPKELWLADLGVTGKWPCHGIMEAVYMDNAAEFRGKMLERSCQEYGIEINFRPVATPNYGGHIERLLGTVLREIHTLSGTTFSNTRDRKYYDSEGKACLTLKELERWLTTFILGVYHQRLHTGINTTPLSCYNKGLLGSELRIGPGANKPIENELKLKLDFMPFVERTVQRYGVAIDLIWYYGDVLRKWINSYQDPNARYPSLRKFAFKRDPRDISVIYFYDPELKDYFCIPYRNATHPAITIWEHKRILRDLKDRGMAEVNENMIFEAYANLQTIEQNAAGNVAAARRLRNTTRKQQSVQNSMKNYFTDLREELFIEGEPDNNIKYLPFEDIEHDPFNHHRSIG